MSQTPVRSTIDLPSFHDFALPESFVQRKSRILASLDTPGADYADKSPKGSVDGQICELINEINKVEGWVTTSSCSGRVTVFAEGSRSEESANRENSTEIAKATLLSEDNDESDRAAGPQKKQSKKQGSAGPGGKGHGGHWLFVSHEPLDVPSSSRKVVNDARSATVGNSETTEEEEVRTDSPLMHLFGLKRRSSTASSSNASYSTSELDPDRRLIRLAFSPLILHVLCASLHHARHLLSAAINAGFRESGVQSLKALDDPNAGVMVAIRTAGVSFETIIGVIGSPPPNREGKEQMEAVVEEGYLQMCAAVVNKRFAWNDLRRERLREEIKQTLKTMNRKIVLENKDERRQRKKMEGLRRRHEKELQQKSGLVTTIGEQVVFDDELHLEFS